MSLYDADRSIGLLESQTCIFISHNRDSELFAATDESAAYDVIFVLNRAGLTKHQHEQYETFAQDARRRGRNVIVLRSSASIYEDLTGHSVDFGPDGGTFEPVEGMNPV